MASSLTELVRAETLSAPAIADWLDGRRPDERIEAIRSIGGVALQSRLYQACAQARPVTLVDLVPTGTPPLTPVIHYGKNSLPMFTIFEKRFCRSPDRPDELWGYNHQAQGWITGPGYFVAHEEPGLGAVIDYRRVPPRGCEGWPAVKPNHAGFSRFVYRDMVDRLRRVSSTVFIGRATRNGQELENYFLLCRG